MLKKGTVLGSVESISAIIPVAPWKEMESEKPKKGRSVNVVDINEISCLPEVDVSHFSDKQRLLKECCMKNVMCSAKKKCS